MRGASSALFLSVCTQAACSLTWLIFLREVARMLSVRGEKVEPLCRVDTRYISVEEK